MTDRHLDEGIIQAYIDGELSQKHAAATATHLAACEACSAALADAEDDSSFFANAFAPDESLSVPTAALRARVNAAVAQLETSTESKRQHSQGWSFSTLFAPLSGLFTFTPRTAAAFATLLVAVAAGIIYFSSQRSQQTQQNPQTQSEVAQVNPSPEQPSVVTPPAPVAPPALETRNANVSHTITRQKGARLPQSGRDPYELVRLTPGVFGSDKRVYRGRGPRMVPKAEELPGEKAYQTAIASLEKTIKFGGEQSLRPAVRADYERNIALLDSAIQQTRQVAAQNPKDKDAVGFLMSAYQSKVELLTRVADQAQVAALGR